MILYFSGTGNSRYVAQKISAETGDTLISINEKLKAHDTSAIDVSGHLVIAAPVYAWRLPRIVTQWMTDTKFTGVDGVWFVITCGGSIGNAAKYARRLCDRLQLPYCGTKQIVMPENYIAMFKAPDEAESRQIIAAAARDIAEAAAEIKAGKPFRKPRCVLSDRFLSSVMNSQFYASCVKSRGFRAVSGCTGCGLCVTLCPLNNIRLENGKPVWGNQCTHCMACICRCPTEAIEYKNKTRGKRRYHLD